MVEIEKSLVRVRNFACTNRIYLSAMFVATTAVAFFGFFSGIFFGIYRVNLICLIFLIGIVVSLLVLCCGMSIYLLRRQRDIWQIRVNIPKRVVKYPCCRAAMKEFVKIVALATFVVFLIHLIEDNKKTVIGIVVFCVAFYLFLLTFMVVFGFTEGFDVAAAFLAASFVILYRECNGHIYLIAMLVVGTCLLGAFKGLVLHGVEELGIGRVEDGVEDGVEVEV